MSILRNRRRPFIHFIFTIFAHPIFYIMQISAHIKNHMYTSNNAGHAYLLTKFQSCYELFIEINVTIPCEIIYYYIY